LNALARSPIPRITRIVRQDEIRARLIIVERS
jgi:hypothetical protein